MAQHIDDEVVYYYDSHPTEEDLMGETSFHAALVHYLVEVLQWLFHGQRCAIYENLNFYTTSNPTEYPLAPDIAVIKGVSFRHVRSWRVEKNGPPQVVFEIASDETWRKDLKEKPSKYARMRVEEYFAYDPNIPPIWRPASRRLLGWHFDREQGRFQPLRAEARGRLWSAQLESWLVPDGPYLRLYNQHGQLRLTQAEAEAQRAEVLAERLRALGIDPDQV